MNEIIKRRVTFQLWQSALAVCLIMTLITGVFLSEDVSAIQHEQSKSQELKPDERKEASSNRQPDRRGPRRQFDGAQRNHRDMRLLPSGVAFPRAVIRVFRQLDLTSDQRERLEQLARRSGNQIPALHRLRMAQSELLDEALYSENFNPQLVEQRANDLAATQSEIIKLQVRIMAHIRQILSPEQSIKFRKLLTLERERLIRHHGVRTPNQSPNN